MIDNFQFQDPLIRLNYNLPGIYMRPVEEKYNIKRSEIMPQVKLYQEEEDLDSLVPLKPSKNESGFFNISSYIQESKESYHKLFLGSKPGKHLKISSSITSGSIKTGSQVLLTSIMPKIKEMHSRNLSMGVPDSTNPGNIRRGSMITERRLSVVSGIVPEYFSANKATNMKIRKSSQRQLKQLNSCRLKINRCDRILDRQDQFLAKLEDCHLIAAPDAS